MEEVERAEHNHAALEDALPHPNKEGLNTEGSALLHGLVEWREFHHGVHWYILI